jgi:hypothetical protein
MKVSVFSLMVLCLIAAPSLADSITITSNRDTTIYKGFVNNSNGGGVAMFAGDDSNSKVSRGLIGFDIHGNVPSGATIQSVQLTLYLGQVAGAGSSGTGGDATPRTISLTALSDSWGEGTAGSGTTVIPGSGSGFAAGNGDATWNDRAFSASTPITWTNPGGDFAATASGSTLVGNPAAVPAPFVWLTTAAMVSDVQSWLDSPSGNFGWILTNSNESAAKTSRAFYTREATDPSIRPSLTITYATPEPSALTSLALGLLGFVVVVRHKRQRDDCCGLNLVTSIELRQYRLPISGDL